jgi:hypothetical protein
MRPLVGSYDDARVVDLKQFLGAFLGGSHAGSMPYRRWGRGVLRCRAAGSDNEYRDDVSSRLGSTAGRRRPRQARGAVCDGHQNMVRAPFDYNRDGAQDVLINYHGGAKLWENRGGGRYRRVARYAWPHDNSRGAFIDRHNCAWADVDRNRRPDVYCSAGRTEDNLVKHRTDNELWLQNRHGRFAEVGTPWGAGDLCGRGRAVVFLDANGDVYPDLFVGNDTPRPRTVDPCDHSTVLPNEESKLFINVHGTRFRYAPRMGDFGAGPGTRCAEVVDFDADGWDDLFTCGVGNEAPQLFRNRRGHAFADVTAKHGFNQPINDATTADLDGDGDVDVVTATPEGFAYHLNNSGVFGTSTVIGSVPIGSEGRSVAVGDGRARAAREPRRRDLAQHRHDVHGSPRADRTRRGR